MVPSGYERLLLGHAVAIARADLAPNVRRALIAADGTRSTLHEYAATHPRARHMQGRGAAYAVPLPQRHEQVVVRHNRHGGVFGRLRGDRFLSPTRAPHELSVSLKLRKLGVQTPEIVAYALYPPGGLLQRSDVCSREIPNSRDLAEVLLHDSASERAAALAATAALVAALAHASARHHDLNAKNVLLNYESAYVLDVDRIQIGGEPQTVLWANLTRLSRSLRKWRDQFGAHVSERDIGILESESRRLLKRT
jgi:tRNA A-37 threonylcarbamoyl transferase component Bud32